MFYGCPLFKSDVKMTNKEKFKEIFGIEPDCGRCNPYPCEENDCKYWEQCENQPGCPCDNWWDWEFKEPNTKNDLGVDCISREQALVAIRNLYPDMPRVDFNGSLRKWVDKYKPYIECDDTIKQLPSVPPHAKDVPNNNAGEILNKLRAKMEEISSNMNPEDEWDYGYKAGVEDLIQFLNQDLKEPKAESEEDNGNEAV